jgi:hypothetical protein
MGGGFIFCARKFAPGSGCGKKNDYVNNLILNFSRQSVNFFVLSW